MLTLCLEQIPKAHLDRPMLARSDSAGATHEFAAALSETGVRFFQYADHGITSGLPALFQYADQGITSECRTRRMQRLRD